MRDSPAKSEILRDSRDIPTLGGAPATEVAGFGRGASLVCPRLDPDPLLPVVGSRVTRTGWQRATADGVGVSCSRLQSRPGVVRHLSRRPRYRAFVALVDIYTIVNTCDWCTARRTGKPPKCGNCGWQTSSFAHAIRYICMRCKTGTPKDFCQCTVFLKIAVHVLSDRWL